MCIQVKLKMCIFSVRASLLKSVQNLFAKIVRSGAFVIGFPKSCKMLKSNDWK